jgi:hypothetical protein
MVHIATTGRHDRGVNVLVLWATAAALGYTSSEWATYKKWQEKGAQARNGERSTLDYSPTASVTVLYLNGKPGLTVEVRREGTEFMIQSSGSGTWKVFLVGITAIKGVEGGTVENSDLGVVVTPDAGAELVTVQGLRFPATTIG